jgi:hypothetical protein
VEQQLGPEEEPQQEQDQTDVTVDDAEERLSDLEERVTHVENVADVVAQSEIQEPFGAVFPARFDTSGNFQELCVVNNSISDMIGGRSSSGWTGIPLGAGQGLVVECEDYDASNSRSKMQFLLLGAGTSSAPSTASGFATITATSGSASAGFVYSANKDSSAIVIYNTLDDGGALVGTPGSLGVTVNSDGTNAGGCHLKAIGLAKVPVTWDASTSKWVFAISNSAE